MSDWQPDLLLTRKHPLGRYAAVYLDGKLVDHCFEARIKLSSFQEPTFGEVIVAAPRGDRKITPASLTPPYLGEFCYEGAWARLACGKVFISLTEAGRDLLATIITDNKLGSQ